MKEDLRVKKTKNALRKALSTLLKTKSLDKITIMEICENAMVNRVTFYSHYEDKKCLFKYYINSITNKVIEKCYISARPYEGLQRATTFFLKLFDELVLCMDYISEESMNNIEYMFYLIYDTQHQASRLIKCYMVDSKVFRNNKYSSDIIIEFLFGATSNMARNYFTEENLAKKVLIKEQFALLIENFVRGVI